MEPKTLQAAIVYFSNPDNCLNYMVARLWPDGIVTCPTCGRKDVVFLKNQRKWQCKSIHPKRQFSVKVGTLMEDSPIPLDKWLTATWMITNCKNGISSYEIHRAIGVTQKTAWFMLHRIRKAMQTESYIRKMQGHVEVDETFIGGKARNMHRSRARKLNLRGRNSKAIVVGILERGTEVRTQVVAERDKRTLGSLIREHVDKGTPLYTDAHLGYDGLKGEYPHEVIDHAAGYVRGLVHTNGLENFWSLLKRGLHGTYVAVEPFHLFRYIDEQAFRFNNRATKKRHVTDSDRFRMVTSQVAGKRLTYQELTGKVGKPHQLPDDAVPF